MLTTVIDNDVFAEYVRNTYKLESKLIEYGGDHVNSIKGY